MAMQLTASASDRDNGAGSDRRAARRIAIVEDEALVAWALESMAEELGHDVVGIFAAGEEALAALGGEPPDIVFMDINLGRGMDGIETAARLRRDHPVAILFISAYSDPATRERALAAAPGALLLGKPVQASLLEKAISYLSASRD